MRNPIPAMPLLAGGALVGCVLAGCASMGEPAVPAGAVEATRTEANGDVVSEYRVQGQLRLVRVQPSRGPVYYLIDSNGDGRLDSNKGEVSPVYYRLYGW